MEHFLNSRTPRDLRHFGNPKNENLLRSPKFYGENEFQVKICIASTQFNSRTPRDLRHFGQFNSWLMSNMLFNFRLSCTIFHGTFFNSDHFFRTLVVKILIFIRKKSAYLEFQLCFFVKIWLSPGKRRKK